MPVPADRHIAVHMEIDVKVEMEVGLPALQKTSCGDRRFFF